MLEDVAEPDGSAFFGVRNEVNEWEESAAFQTHEKTLPELIELFFCFTLRIYRTTANGKARGLVDLLQVSRNKEQCFLVL